MCVRGGEACYTREMGKLIPHAGGKFPPVREEDLNLYRLFRFKSPLDGVLQHMSNDLKEEEEILEELKKRDLKKEFTYFIVAS